MSSNPEVSTEDLAGTGAHREPQYGEAADRASDPSMTRAGLGEDLSAAGQGRTGAAVGGPTPDDAGAGDGWADADADTGPIRSAETRQQNTGQQGTERLGAQRPGEPPGASTDRGAAAGPGDIALLDPAEEQGFRQRWSDTQARFVDAPQEAVQTADGLVAELMQSLARGFSEHKGRLEAQWRSGGSADTEDLRQALQRYRSFFDRLLST